MILSRGRMLAELGRKKFCSTQAARVVLAEVQSQSVDRPVVESECHDDPEPASTANVVPRKRCG